MTSGARSSGDDPWSWLGTAGGEAARLIREVDWAQTAVGPVQSWPPSLKSLLVAMVHARQPMFLWWGPKLVQFYNDGYAPSFGVGRHPSALGQPGEECWADIWPIIGPEIASVIETRQSTFHEDALVPIFRNGRMEEVYWTYGYSPVFESDGSVAGVLVIVTETTSRVIAVRRLRAARALADAISGAERQDDLLRAAVQVLEAGPEDAPWALVHTAAGAAPGQDTVPAQEEPRPAIATKGLDATAAADLCRLLEAHLARSDSLWLEPIDVSAIAGLPGGPWPEAATRAISLPLRGGDDAAPYAHLLIGLSPRLPFDAAYEDHVRGLRGQLASAAQRIDSQRARVAAEEARNALLMGAPVAAALLVGPEWRFELANPAYVRIVGRDVVGRTWRECFPELRASATEAVLERVYQHGEAMLVSEQLVRLASEGDGVQEDRFFNFSMSPILAPNGSVVAMTVVAVELTAQVKARQDLERTALERERLVRELETASRAKDEFLAMMGHELRNPLAPIVAALELMRARGGDGSSREQAVIGRQVNHLLRLVDDLLDISRITQGKVELRVSTSEVASVVEHAVEIVTELFNARQHELSVQVAPGLRWHGDATRLEQILANLLTNAARYTEPGGQIGLTIAREKGTLVLRVRDSGRGIDTQLLARIFEPFIQGRRGFDRREGGLGLGLAIVRGLVELHGGKVEAHSAGTGQGSEFVVRLPGLVTSQAPPPPAPTNAFLQGPPPAHAPRVLIVDDNRDAADLLAQLLQTRGLVVAVAYDGQSALALVDDFRPEVAFLDIGLPGMDGYELVRQLRARHGASDCRYFALTGYGQKSDIERAATAGFEELLIKPIDFGALRRILG